MTFATQELAESPAHYATRIDQEGFAVVENVIDASTVQTLRAAVDSLGEREGVLRRGSIYGVRNLLEAMPEALEIARHPALRALATPVLGDRCFAVRGTLFDKNPEANWSLFWHQDSLIAVSEQRDVPGFSKWARKAGLWHVEPPHEIFQRMLTLRLHIDDCGEQNGPLRVLPGSHRGRWQDRQLDEWKRNEPEVVCTVGAGGVLVMRPLLLHASAASEVPSHRRVLQIEYAAGDLPGGLEWAMRI